MCLKQREGVVGGGPNAMLPFGTVSEQKRLEHIDHLRNVAHMQLVGRAVKDVEPHSGGEGATHGALLPKLAITPFIFFGNVVPHTPLVENEANLLTLLIAVEHGALMNDRFLDFGIGGEL